MERPTPLNAADRRRGARVPFPAELLLLWHHAPSHPVSYRIVDAGNGGFRIRTADSAALFPHCMGMTGMAVKVLPGNSRIEQAVCVAWVRPCEHAGNADGYGGFEIGLRYF